MLSIKGFLSSFPLKIFTKSTNNDIGRMRDWKNTSGQDRIRRVVWKWWRNKLKNWQRKEASHVHTLSACCHFMSSLHISNHTQSSSLILPNPWRFFILSAKDVWERKYRVSNCLSEEKFSLQEIVDRYHLKEMVLRTRVPDVSIDVVLESITVGWFEKSQIKCFPQLIIASEVGTLKHSKRRTAKDQPTYPTLICLEQLSRETSFLS